MKRFIKAIVVMGLIPIVFFTGMGVGVYQLWPYHYLHEVKNDFERYLQPLNEFIQIDTGLQYLLIKKKKLPRTVGNGGAISASGNLVFIFTRHGRLLAFDWDSAEQMGNDVVVPMGLKELEKSEIVDLDTFTLENFRVHGVYIEGERKAPDFYRMYVTHHFYANGCITLRLSRVEIKQAGNTLQQAGDWRTLFETTPCIDPLLNARNDFYAFSGHAAGGRIISYDKQHLLVSVGDHQFDGRGRAMYAQNSEISYGKIMLIDKETGESSVFAQGVRNPQGLTKDARGRIWETEHGPQGGGELNLIEKGKNYGWPVNTYGIQYGNLPWNPAIKQGRHDRFTKPIFSWIPSIGPTNIIAMDGEKFKSWRGDLLIGSMPAQSLFRLRLDGKRVVYSEQIYLGYRIRDLATLPNGAIGMITDDSHLLIMEDGGAVYDKKQNQEELAAALNKFDKLDFESPSQQTPFAAANLIEENKKRTVQFCLKCHSTREKKINFTHQQEEDERPPDLSTDSLTVAEQSKEEWEKRKVLELIKEPASGNKPQTRK